MNEIKHVPLNVNNSSLGNSIDYNSEKFIEKIHAFCLSFNLKPIIVSSSCCSPEIELFFASNNFKKLPGFTSLKKDISKSNLLIVSGPINDKFLTILEKALNSCEEPKYIIVIGDCALQLRDIVPIDLYLPGCPPKPEELYKALKSLQSKIRKGFLKKRTPEFKPSLESMHDIASFLNFGYLVDQKTEKNIIERIKIQSGFSHRGLEKALIGKTLSESFELLSKTDRSASILGQLLLSKLFAQTFKLDILRDEEFIEVLYLELLRISSHLWNLAKLSNALGFNSLYREILKSEESIRIIFEKVFKKRFSIFMYDKDWLTGPIKNDILQDLSSWIPQLSKVLSLIENKIFSNYNVKRKLGTLGCITKTQAINYLLSGPNLRATGLNIDCRKEMAIYENFGFKAVLGEAGTAFDRFKIRFDEIVQSRNIISYIAGNLKGTSVSLKNLGMYINKQINYVDDFIEIESPQGKVGFFITIEKSKIVKFKMVESSSSVTNMLDDFFVNIPLKYLDLFLVSFDIDVVSMDK